VTAKKATNPPRKWVAVEDREGGWSIVCQAPWVPDVTNRRGRVTKYRQALYPWQYPEKVSCFVSASRIIEATTEEEAWRLL
jgi:hypothetical protein